MGTSDAAVLTLYFQAAQLTPRACVFVRGGLPSEPCVAFAELGRFRCKKGKCAANCSNNREDINTNNYVPAVEEGEVLSRSADPGLMCLRRRNSGCVLCSQGSGSIASVVAGAPVCISAMLSGAVRQASRRRLVILLVCLVASFHSDAIDAQHTHRCSSEELGPAPAARTQARTRSSAEAVRFLATTIVIFCF